MRKYFCALCVSIVALMMVAPAFANELWDYHVRGGDEGLAFGALAPPGLYFINDFYWAPAWRQYDNGGNTVPGVKANGYIDVPILLWVPGCQFLGAAYGAAISEPFDQVTLRAITPAGPLSGSQWGASNTIVVPFILSWHIPCNFFVSTAFQIGLNDGTTSPGDSAAAQPGNPLYHLKDGVLFSKDLSNIYGWSANDSYQFTPTIGVSWLYNGWNISGEFAYTWYTKDTDTDYLTGGQFWADYTLSYTCGRWTFGVGAAQENQVYNDKFNALVHNASGSVIGVTGYKSQPGSMAVNYSVGPLIGYNFGPCSLLMTYNFAVSTKNDIGGDWFNLRLVIPLGNPCAWWN